MVKRQSTPGFRQHDTSIQGKGRVDPTPQRGDSRQALISLFLLNAECLIRKRPPKQKDQRFLTRGGLVGINILLYNP